MDSIHKLVSFRLVFHGCVDGYSRLIILFIWSVKIIIKLIQSYQYLKMELQSMECLVGYVEIEGQKMWKWQILWLPEEGSTEEVLLLEGASITNELSGCGQK